MTRKISGFIWCIVLLATTSAYGADVVEYLDEHQEKLLSIQQGWGQLGISTCAHAPGQKPQAISIKGRTYQRGLGHHAPGEIVVELDGQYARFESQVGVQDLPAGSVVFAVYVDDEKKFDSGVMRTGDAAKPVAVDLAGAQELRLAAGDAGDGINCDCANWAEARLVRNPNAKPAASGSGFDVARFARVIASDPSRKTGAASNRIQEFRAEDVYLDQDLRPDARGEYAARGPVGTIGLRWVERRLLRRLEIEFATAPDERSRSAASVEYWSGESPWQGGWKPLPGSISAEANRWTFRVDPAANTRGGTWKVRWIIPAGREAIIVRRLKAFTPARLANANLRIQFDQTAAAPINLDIYNGELTGPTTEMKLDPSKPTTLTVHYVKARPWQSDRTTLRFHTAHSAFAVAIDDVLANKAVYVPQHGAFISLADAKLDLDSYHRSIAARQTILRQVRQMPDQTLRQAMQRVHHAAQDEMPTLLSLACDNRKFIVNRDGTTLFAAATDGKEQISADRQKYPFQFKPIFGSGKPEKLTRELAGGWLPAPTISAIDAGVAYRMCSFVAPAGTEAAGNIWLNASPVYVADIAMQNPSDAARPARVTLGFATPQQRQIKLDGRRAIIDHAGQLLAIADIGEGGRFALSAANELVATATLDRAATIHCRVCIPAWPAKPEGQAALSDTTKRFDNFKAYWQRILAGAMQVDIPDPLLMNIIRASQVHCLIAARNEADGQRIAPWIASISYGPLESESNSIIRAMDLFGHAEFARRSLDYFIHRYNSAGYLTTGYTLMGHGWHLWTLGEHCELNRDDAWLKPRAAKVASACEWIAKQRAKNHATRDPRPIESGLMPPGVMADWNAYAYYFCLNGYYYAGLQHAASALKAANHPQADALLADAQAFRRDILRAYRAIQVQTPVVPLGDGTSVPPYPSQLLPGPTGLFFPGEDGNRSWCYDVELGSHQLVPQGVLPADSPEVAAMMDHMEDVQFLADGWFDYPATESHKDPFNLGGFSKVQPYYTRNAEIYAMRDDVKPFVRSYFNTLSSLINLENLSLQEHFNRAGAWNKTHETGYFLQQTRFMLVMERGQELWLAPMVTSNWMKDGMAVEVRRAPTRFGPVSYRIESSAAKGWIEATIDPPVRSSPQKLILRLRHPDGKPMRSVTVNGKPHAAFNASRDCITIDPTQARIIVRATY